MKTLKLEARTIYLRRMQPEDAEMLFAYRVLPEVARYQDWRPDSLDEVRDLAARQAELEPGAPGTWFQFIVCRRKDDATVGDCGILFPAAEHAAPELGCSLHPEHRRRGYATAASRLMLDYLFGELGVHRVVTRVIPHNLPAVAVLNRLDMRQEAHFRQSCRHRGEWVDDMVFAMLREEWERTRRDRDGGRVEVREDR